MNAIGNDIDINMRAQTLVNAYYGRLYQLAFRLCSNAETAKDLAFRALEKALEAKVGSFSDERAYFAWLCKILTNLYRDMLRLKAANAIEFVEKLPEWPDQRPDPAMLLEQSECQKILKEAIRGLPLPLREVVVMYYFEDYSVKVLSEILDVPEGTVKYRLFEARKILSRTLGQTFSEDSPLNKKGESET